MYFATELFLLNCSRQIRLNPFKKCLQRSIELKYKGVIFIVYIVRFPLCVNCTYNICNCYGFFKEQLEKYDVEYVSCLESRQKEDVSFINCVIYLQFKRCTDKLQQQDVLSMHVSTLMQHYKRFRTHCIVDKCLNGDCEWDKVSLSFQLKSNISQLSIHGKTVKRNNLRSKYDNTID